MTNGSEHDFKPYYNVPLPTAASDAPSSLSSECTSEEPARPPRTCDSGNKVPSYCNLPDCEDGRGGEGEQPMQPPVLPRRQPHLRASPVALRCHPPPPLPPPPPPPLSTATTAMTAPTNRQSQQQHVFNFPPSSSTKFSCASTDSTASPTQRLPTYQNYRKRSAVVGRSRTLAGTPRRGAAVGGCQCGRLGSAAAAASESGKFDERWGKNN